MFINPLRNCDEQGFNSSIVLSDWQVLIKKSWQDKFSRGWGWEDRVKNVIIFWDNDILVRTSKFIKVGGGEAPLSLSTPPDPKGEGGKGGGHYLSVCSLLCLLPLTVSNFSLTVSVKCPHVLLFSLLPPFVTE